MLFLPPGTGGRLRQKEERRDLQMPVVPISVTLPMLLPPGCSSGFEFLA